MRGQQTLFTQLIHEPPKRDIQTAGKPGRSEALIHNRDRRLLYRYYYYSILLNKAYPVIIRDLSQQFDLSESRVIVCLTAKHGALKAIIAAKPSIRELQGMYPWMNWIE